MNEEEKKAIEELEEFIKGPCEICKYCEGAYKLNRKNVIQLLNLTKKLQKENEELKAENEYNKLLLDTNKNFTIDKKNGNYKWNVIEIQKVKEKIEELDRKITYIESQYTNGGQNCNSNYLSALYQKQVLQELLESEE